MTASRTVAPPPPPPPPRPEPAVAYLVSCGLTRADAERIARETRRPAFTAPPFVALAPRHRRPTFLSTVAALAAVIAVVVVFTEALWLLGDWIISLR